MSATRQPSRSPIDTHGVTHHHKESKRESQQHETSHIMTTQNHIPIRCQQHHKKVETTKGQQHQKKVHTITGKSMKITGSQHLQNSTFSEVNNFRIPLNHKATPSQGDTITERQHHHKEATPSDENAIRESRHHQKSTPSEVNTIRRQNHQAIIIATQDRKHHPPQKPPSYLHNHSFPAAT